MIRECSQANKTSTLPNGVSRYTERNGMICFNVLVYEKTQLETKLRIKHFRVSKAFTEKFVEQIAIAFRKYYELCAKHDKKFVYTAFDDWQNSNAVCRAVFGIKP